MTVLRVSICGVVPLIMENKRMSDPMDPLVRRLGQLTKMRTKTDDVYLAISKLEMEGYLYLDEATGLPCIPDYVWRGFFVSTGGAAKKFKEGPIAKIGLGYLGHALLEYEGPTDFPGLFEEGFYRVDMLPIGRGNRVRRTRPQFPAGWRAAPVFDLDDDVIQDAEATLEKWMIYGGRRVGLMGWRPTYGRFEVEDVQTVDEGT